MIFKRKRKTSDYPKIDVSVTAQEKNELDKLMRNIDNARTRVEARFYYYKAARIINNAQTRNSELIKA